MAQSAKFEINRNIYPFEDRYLELADGKIHYVDEGAGDVLLFIHGTPTWSFLYRRQIDALRTRYRCIALDHMGFGLSDKPKDASYTPQDHSRRLGQFIESLDLKDITLVVHDFGGPIGLSRVLETPHLFRRLVLINTWMWPLQSEKDKKWVGKIVRSPLGRYLYLHHNFSARVMVKAAFADKANLTSEIHRHYLGPFFQKEDRLAPWKIGCELLSDWYDRLWQMRDILSSFPAVIIWGMKDPAFGEKYLNRWENLFKNRKIYRLKNVGHFPQEEAPEIVTNAILDHFQ